ncbi:MAG TPA: hypothetical protein VF179_14580 [Thermoanaerobaculia bacterium]|nr:hypothetical protein [Thermoanaerobaculia bacterium]
MPALTDVYTGANGALLFIGESGTEGADATAVTDLEAFSLAVVGRVTNVEIRIDTDLEEFHEIGLRHASSLHPGNIHIHGSIGRAYVNGALLYMLMGRGASPNSVAEPYVQPALAMNVVLQTPAAPDHRSVIDLYGVKFENWAFSLPEDDFVVESVRFKALRINVRDEVGGTAQVPAFPA